MMKLTQQYRNHCTEKKSRDKIDDIQYDQMNAKFVLVKLLKILSESKNQKKFIFEN